MTPGLSTAALYTDLQGLSQLRVEAREETPDAIKAVAKEFEAIFMQMMLKSMRDASLGEGLLDSDQGKFYQEMFDKQIATSLSREQGMGLADIMVRQLSRGKDSRQPGEALAVSGAQKTTPSFTSPTDFINKLTDMAKSIGKKLGVSPKVLLAQSALETGWGQNVMRKPDGGSSHNLFGIKADQRWDGDKVVTTTLEYSEGIAEKEQASFRSYQSYEESFEDYAQFIMANPRYEKVLQSGQDPAAYARSLQQAGYASDPDYARKINSIMQNEIFQQVQYVANDQHE